MKIVIIGGSGLIGTKLGAILQQNGHEVLAASPSTGVNTITREGLAEALEGAQVVVDVANAPVWEDKAVLDFFETSGRNLLAAEKAAGVKHHVALSVVGTERLQDSGYFRAKLVQENLVRSSPIPFTLIRATQFFEFVDAVLSWTSDENTVRLPDTPVQPIASADIAKEVAKVCMGEPLNGIRNVGGPEVFTLDELGRIALAAKGDKRTVVVDDTAGMFAAVKGDVLTAPADAMLAGTTFREWLASRR